MRGDEGRVGPADRARPILVAGAPRTGTTWVARALTLADDVVWVNEPDNEWPNVYALRAKRSLGRFPVLLEGDRAPAAYERLWERALAGFVPGRLREALAWKLDRGERTMLELWRAMCDHASPYLSPRLRLAMLGARPPGRRLGRGRVLVKTVHAPLALGWIAARFEPQVVLVLRHPLNVVASWVDLGWGGCALDTNPTVRRRLARWGLPDLGPDATPLQRVAFEVGLFTCELEGWRARRPDWAVAEHEALCLDPPGGFRALASRLGLSWSERAELFLEESNQPGAGYSLFRLAAEQPERWRRRLSPEQVREAWSVLRRFEAPWVERVARDLE
jgi:hypothetical protein